MCQPLLPFMGDPEWEQQDHPTEPLPPPQNRGKQLFLAAVSPIGLICNNRCLPDPGEMVPMPLTPSGVPRADTSPKRDFAHSQSQRQGRTDLDVGSRYLNLPSSPKVIPKDS